MKKLILTVVFVIGMVAATFGQTVIIKNMEKVYGTGWINPGIQITIDGETTFIEYEKGKLRNENSALFTEMFQSELIKFLDDGYIIISDSAASTSTGNYSFIFTTYILRKE